MLLFANTVQAICLAIAARSRNTMLERYAEAFRDGERSARLSLSQSLQLVDSRKDSEK